MKNNTIAIKIASKLNRLLELKWVQIALIGGLIALLYGSVIHAPFIWDDQEMILNNPHILQLSNMKQILTSSAFGPFSGGDSFYRPLQILTYSLDYAIWGFKPIGFRLMNIMLHFWSSIGIWMLLRRLGHPGLKAWLGGMLFACHPVAIECVTYLSGRGDVLMACFSIWGLVLILGGKKERWVAVLMYLLAIFTKENAIVLPLLMGMVIGIKKDAFRAYLGPFSAMVGMMLIMIGSRLVQLQHSTSQTLSWIAEANLWERIATVPYIAVTYLRLWWIPSHLHMEYHYVATSFINKYSGLLILILASLILWGYLGSHSIRKWLIWGSVWIIVALGTVWNVAIPLASTVREHWFYLPLVGAVIMMIGLLDQVRAHRKWWTIGVMLWIGFLSTQTILRNQDWLSGERLYQHDVRLEPKSFLLHNNLGVMYYVKGNLSMAKMSFENAIEATPGKGYGVAINNLGAVYETLGNVPMAIQCYYNSIEANRYYKAYTNLARVLLKQQNMEEAGLIIQKGLSKYPMDPMLKQYKMILQNQNLQE